jgi:hypothetical protein
VRGACISVLLLGGVALVDCSSAPKTTSGGAGATAGAAGGQGGASGAPGTGGASAGTAGDGAGGTGPIGGDDGSAGGGAAGSGSGGASGASGGAGGESPDGGGADDAADGRDFSTDRTTFFGASRCAQARVQLCEDFESGTLDPMTWSVRGGKPVIDDLQKARGSKALHVTVMGNGLSAISETKTFPAPNDTYYGRVFVYFASLPAPATGFDYAHWTMLAATGTQVSGEIRVSGQMQSGHSLWGVGTDNRVDANGTGDWTNSDKDPNGKPLPVPMGQWMCIEWMHKGDTNETRFWWDGVEHPSLYTKPSTPHGGNPNEPYILPQFTSVWLGWQEYQATTEKFELWLDEIAIDKDRIGCVI